ncbi:oxidoreductase [Luteimicrobium album]|uniref:Oxidoreductase n=1 Tax=Luteimicrobium album TaxID=1054550 RepID=A0ABQ6I2A3_9MICO|nr:ferredoxin reductase [Luteimicrobium album]GMA23929.1 oxidoreductase [Luteimicrobium album]
MAAPSGGVELGTAGTAAPARLGERFATTRGWRVATLASAHAESATARTLELDVLDWPGHLAGQHVDLRLTAADGYTAERAYSLSAPLDPAAPGRVAVTVQRVPDGEVSPYLVDAFEPGQLIEVRGPVGGWFVWEPGFADAAPVLLIAGGSGIVPLIAMVRARRGAGNRTSFRLLYSVRTPDDAMFTDELTGVRGRADGVEAQVFYTRAAPLDAAREARRIGLQDVAAHGWPPELRPVCYVCGPTGFVEAVTRMLLALGHDPAAIRAERFGPAGD